MADDGMEHTNIVEFYPEKIDNRATLEGMDAMLRPGNRYMCPIILDGYRFTRTIYRPINGPDLLISQSKEEDVEYSFFRRIPLAVAANRNALYNFLIGQEDTNLRRPHLQNWNPNWSWADVAARVCQHVEDNGLFQREPEIYGVTAEEAFGTLSIMSEAPGWYHIAPRPPIEETTECVICLQDMTHDDSIEFHCRHVCHKHCLFPVLWNTPGTNCWLCDRPILV